MAGRSLGLRGQLYARFREATYVSMVLMSVVIGLLGGLFAVAFRKFIGLGNYVAWGDSEYTLDYIMQLPFWWKIAVPATGGLIVGLIIHYFAREAKGHGVPEVMEAVALKGGRIRPRVVVIKMFASGLCIASGGSVGREGPIVQIGSAIGSTLGQWLRLGQREIRTLVGCGAAAGIAGTFNAPVAGALFAVEIILGDFAVSNFTPIVISSVAATVVGRYYLGDVPAFRVPTYELVHANELFAHAILGLLAGVVALGFVKTLYAFEDLFDRVRLYGPLKTLFGGAIIGLIALKFPHIYGVGYEVIEEALKGGPSMIWQVLIVLVVVKILAVSITIGSGGSAGIFAPSLFIGAMLGGAVGTVVHSLWPASTAGPGAYALVGMGAVVGATTHGPITAILIIFELTSEYKIILPLMLAVVLATAVARLITRESIYTLKLIRRGVKFSTTMDQTVLRRITADKVTPGRVPVIGPEQPFQEVVEQLEQHGPVDFVVADEDGTYLGMLTTNNIQLALLEREAVPLLVVGEVMRTDIPSVTSHEPLDSVFDKFAADEVVALAVTQPETNKVIGTITQTAVMGAYMQALAE